MQTMKTRTKAFLYAQFNPAKTLKQLIQDRNLYRASINAVLIIVLFV